jgi:hypothetical protein
MRKYFIVAFILIGAVSYVWAAASVCTQTVTKYPNARVVMFECTANTTTGTFDDVDTSAAVLNDIQGYYIKEVRIDPGSTAPTDAYDIVINDVLGIDLLGGEGVNASNVTSTRVLPKDGYPLVDDTLTLAITGNSVNAAQTTVKVFVEKTNW